jgi:hypothetical protein
MYDPVRLIESLQLRASEQQDAQEYVCFAKRPEPLLFPVQVFETIHVTAKQRISKTRSARVENLPYGPSELRPSRVVSHKTYEYSSKGIRFTVLNVMVVTIALNDKPTF